jgi:plasmid maintenance system killer protein
VTAVLMKKYVFQALRMHPLKGNHAGQYSTTFTGNYRLTIEKVQEEKVCVIDVGDYHGD